jgi:sugar/nucleoside kinase (ribokinase family)
VMPLTYHIVGDSYVDLFCFLKGSLPELGGDSTLTEPVQIFAGGSTINTATHLRMLSKCQQLLWTNTTDADGHEYDSNSKEETNTAPTSVVVQTMLNPNDEYGRILLRHAEKHDFAIHNCSCSTDSSAVTAASETAAGTGTPHCVVIVSDRERSFMTHRGCSETFTALDLRLEDLIHTDGAVHLHVAGFFCTPGFGDGSLMKQLVTLRSAREKQWPNQPTIVSLVTQFDVTQGWDGGLDEVVPLLSCVIMNELEATNILERVRGCRMEATAEVDRTREWMSFFSSLNPNAIFVVTQGADGAIAFRSDKLIGSVGPALAVDVVDPTGAGDAFAAGFLHGLWRFGRDGVWSDAVVKHALSWGCAVGTAAVTIRGASIPSTPQRILELYEKQNEATGTN